MKTLMYTRNDKIEQLTIVRCTGENLPRDFSHFPNLTRITVMDTLLDTMPIFGDKVTHITCENNGMRLVQSLPPNLKYLKICRNLFYNSNAFDIPDSVESVILSENTLTTFTDKLPSRLKVLELNYNLLTTLPEIPQTIENLSFPGNQIGKLPPSLPNLRILNCASNCIFELPPRFAEAYPELRTFVCLRNGIKLLPGLPPHLEVLRVDQTFFHKENYRLPAIPESLQYACCDIEWMQELAAIRGWIPTAGVSRTVSFQGPVLRTLDRFRQLYHAIKLRDPLRRWMWRSREHRIRQELSPESLIAFLGLQSAEVSLELLERFAV